MLTKSSGGCTGGPLMLEEMLLAEAQARSRLVPMRSGFC